MGFVHISLTHWFIQPFFACSFCHRVLAFMPFQTRMIFLLCENGFFRGWFVDWRVSDCVINETVMTRVCAVCWSAAWTFLWFVCFCLMADQWSKTKNTSGIPTDAAHAVIAFSFFSIGSWVSVCVICLSNWWIVTTVKPTSTCLKSKVA